MGDRTVAASEQAVSSTAPFRGERSTGAPPGGVSHARPRGSVAQETEKHGGRDDEDGAGEIQVVA
jgi:hypothetical protein